MTNSYIDKLVDEQKKEARRIQTTCVQNYGKEVLNAMQQPIYNESTGGYMCPAYWDTVLCWPPTSAGALATQKCPDYMIGFLPSNNATRQCMDDGFWYSHENRLWTNYSACYTNKITSVFVNFNETNISDVLSKYIPVIHVMSQIGYIVSFITLIIALTIMLCIKKLHCARNILHMHLFVSFIFRALSIIVIKGTFFEGVGLASDINYRNGSLYFEINSETNNWTCKLITSLCQYFITANYSWILMEGLYLHNLIFRTLSMYSSNSIKRYVVMGWGLPLITIGVWVTARLMVEDNLCWNTHENYEVFLIMGIPTMISILLNLCLFMRISVVLYSKLRSPINEDSRRYQKWVKSTLVLVPLFGVHYAVFLSLYFFKANETVEVVWLFCDLLFASLQGLFVAILFCFLNEEVKCEILSRICYIATYLADNKYSKHFFPCRKRFLRLNTKRCSDTTNITFKPDSKHCPEIRQSFPKNIPK